MAGDGRRPPVLKVVGARGMQVARWTLTEIDPPDLAAAEAIARLQASVRAQGWDVVVQSPCPRLRACLELLDLAGLIEDP